MFRIWKELKETERANLTDLRALQSKKLAELIDHAARFSPYYKNLFSAKGIVTKEFDLSRLDELPITDKRTLIDRSAEIQSADDFNKLFVCETSGTSGEVLNFLRNEYWDSFNRASIFKCFGWYDVKPWDFNIYFWGYNTSFKKRLRLRLTDMLVNRYRVFDYHEKTLRKVSRKLKRARFIEGYSSMIYELAKLVDKSVEFKQLRMVKGTSEKIYPHYKDETRKAFGIPIINEYGAAESGLIAFECPEGNMHVNMEGCIVEVDENNEILVTNLLSFSFPVIRYRLGDVVKLKSEDYQCPCGRKHQIIEEVTGRVGKTMHGLKERYPSLTLYYIFKNLYFEKDLKLNYQGHQNEMGILELWLDVEITDSLRRAVLDECEKYFHQDLSIVLKRVDDFRTTEGKLRDFISTIE